MLAFYLSIIEDHENDPIMKQVYDLYQDRMVAYAESILHNYHDAEEAVQNAFIAIAKRINTMEEPQSIVNEAYICTVVRNAALKFHKKNSKHQEVANFDELQNYISESECVAKEYMNNVLYHRLLDYISNMSPTYRDVLMLHYLNQKTPREIADVLDRPLTTVRSQLQRGTKMIKEFFKEDI